MAGAKSTDTSIAEHRATYANFVRLTIAAVIVCAITLVALMAMTLIGGVAFWVGLVGLVAGHVVVAVTLASRLTWTPSLLVLAAIIVLSVLTL
ncbi:MAG: aa3-type cytochrome c oxidase subunit IV [Hyphomicrobiales bacterium]|nr:aa3-type cytochrome c oxidase subunit IV [Hyphomicrobiales bacterium]